MPKLDPFKSHAQKRQALKPASRFFSGDSATHLRAGRPEFLRKPAKAPLTASIYLRRKK